MDVSICELEQILSLNQEEARNANEEFIEGLMNY